MLSLLVPLCWHEILNKLNRLKIRIESFQTHEPLSIYVYAPFVSVSFLNHYKVCLSDHEINWINLLWIHILYINSPVNCFMCRIWFFNIIKFFIDILTFLW